MSGKRGTIFLMLAFDHEIFAPQRKIPATCSSILYIQHCTYSIHLVKCGVKSDTLGAVSIGIIVHFHLHTRLGTVGTDDGTFCSETMLTTNLKSVEVFPQGLTVAPTLEALVTLVFDLGDQDLQVKINVLFTAAHR